MEVMFAEALPYLAGTVLSSIASNILGHLTSGSDSNTTELVGKINGLESELKQSRYAHEEMKSTIEQYKSSMEQLSNNNIQMQNQFNLQKDQLERRALDVETRMNRMQETLQNKINELVGRVESLGKENSDLKKQMKDKEDMHQQIITRLTQQHEERMKALISGFNEKMDSTMKENAALRKEMNEVKEENRRLQENLKKFQDDQQNRGNQPFYGNQPQQNQPFYGNHPQQNQFSNGNHQQRNQSLYGNHPQQNQNLSQQNDNISVASSFFSHVSFESIVNNPNNSKDFVKEFRFCLNHIKNRAGYTEAEIEKIVGSFERQSSWYKYIYQSLMTTISQHDFQLQARPVMDAIENLRLEGLKKLQQSSVELTAKSQIGNQVFQFNFTFNSKQKIQEGKSKQFWKCVDIRQV